MELFSCNNDLLNDVVYGVTDVGSSLLCSFLGPNFLKAVFTNRGCRSGVIMPYAFKSKQNFCYYFKYVWSPNIQKCVTDAPIKILVYLPEIVYGQIIQNCIISMDF